MCFRYDYSAKIIVSTKRILFNSPHSRYWSYHRLSEIKNLSLFSPKPSLKRLSLLFKYTNQNYSNYYADQFIMIQVSDPRS